jgi:hypothetical protein
MTFIDLLRARRISARSLAGPWFYQLARAVHDRPTRALSTGDGRLAIAIDSELETDRSVC